MMSSYPSDLSMVKRDAECLSSNYDREFERDGGSSSQNLDDARSSPSQKSDHDAGYHSSGAMSDSNSNSNSARDRDRDREYNYNNAHLYASMRSSGSVGSQEESQSERERGEYRLLSFKNFYAGHPHAAHMVNGETRFPTAMSYTSDAQRSDAATVCSGSVVEDIEVESVISQEDVNHASSANHSNATQSPLEKQRTISSVSSTRFVEFAGVPGNTNANPNTVIPEQQHAMGPPLNRALLLKADGCYAGGASSSQGAGSIKSSVGSVGSDDCRRGAHWDDGDGTGYSYSSHIDDVEAVPQPDTSSSNKAERASSIKSLEGSEFEGEGAHETETENDDAGSLDVETHSLGTRSIHSQDEAPPLPEDDAPMSTTTAATEWEQATPMHDTSSEETSSGGRQSPGGTIYKGRGTRRYQGRYMHLPLKRFHHNSVHYLDAVDELHSTNPQQQQQQQDSNDVTPWNERGNGYIKRNDNKRSRSRSRSRSPEEDRKPRATNSSFSSSSHKNNNNNNSGRHFSLGQNNNDPRNASR